jgi:phosphomannomutase
MKLLLEKLGCEVIGMNLEPTGLFAHKPEPLPEHLGDLCAAVKKHKADLG